MLAVNGSPEVLTPYSISPTATLISNTLTTIEVSSTTSPSTSAGYIPLLYKPGYPSFVLVSCIPPPENKTFIELPNHSSGCI